MHLLEGVAKKEVARRLGLDVKTVRRALVRESAALARASPPRGRRLDPWRARIREWLSAEPRLSAKRIRRLLLAEVGPIAERSVREYVSELRAELFPREAFIHRTHTPGQTFEADFGDTTARIGGELHRVKFLVLTLPASNAYFAKVYPLERLECLLDGLVSFFRWLGGLPSRGVFDNMSLAVKEVLRGRDRIETTLFHGFRGAFPFDADFCAPAKAWEKGSVERGVEYVRGLCFRPIPEAASFDVLNASVLQELEHDLDHRRLPDGRTAREALADERAKLRALPAHLPEACRVLTRVANRFAHVRVDQVTYSVPLEHARRAVTVKLFHDRVDLAIGEKRVARFPRSFQQGAMVLDPLHVLATLEHKHRAVDEATALKNWKLPAVFGELRSALRTHTRKPDQEWIRVLRLIEEHPLERVEAAIRAALAQGSPRLETVRMVLRAETAERTLVEPVALETEELRAVEVAAPRLELWDELLEVVV
jgi:transposase